jgi:hypothetical protein
MTQLETDLRSALHDRAARVHPSAGLLATDYHPRSRRLLPTVAIGGGLAAAAGALTATLLLAGGASSAFAGWTPKPTTSSAAQVAAANAFCAKNVPFPGLPLKLTDTRGPFTFEVFSDGTSNDFCTTGPSFVNASGLSTSPPVAVPAGRLYVWAEHTASGSGQSVSFLNIGLGDVGAAGGKHVDVRSATHTDSRHAYTTVIAQAGDGVTAADLTLDDGTEVTATVENGWAVAWWPGSRRLARASVTTPSGSRTQTFPTNPCGLHNCAGGLHGPAPGGGAGGG